MTRSYVLRVLVPALFLTTALAGCGDRASGRGALGPRGTALPPPEPVTGAERTTLPGFQPRPITR